MAKVTHQHLDGVAVLTINHPPMNALAADVRTELLAGLLDAVGSAAVRGVVIRGAGRIFCGGADIAEFGSARVFDRPKNADLIATIEAMDKPVVAAIHGHALGGGLELALGCHGRIAARGAKMGLPEVNLGLLPGAGGTQRLPRAVGLAKALEMITEALIIDADESLRTGLVDAVVSEEEIVLRACALVAELAQRHGRGVPLPRVRDRSAHLPAEVSAVELLTHKREDILRRWKGYPARLVAVESVAAADRLPFHEGLQEEQRLVEGLLAGPECRALRYVFASDRAVKKLARAATVPFRASSELAEWGDPTIRASVLARKFSSIDISPELGPKVGARWIFAGLGDSERSLIDAVDQIRRVSSSREKPTGFILLADRALLVGPCDALRDMWIRSGGLAGVHVFGLQPALQPFAQQGFVDRITKARSFELFQIESTDEPMDDQVLQDALLQCWDLGLPAMVSGSHPFTASEIISRALEESIGKMLESGTPTNDILRSLADFGFDTRWCAGLEERLDFQPGSGRNDAEIAERIVLEMGILARKLVDGKYARRTGDVDWLWRTAYGFPPFRGGPSFHTESPISRKAPDDTR